MGPFLGPFGAKTDPKTGPKMEPTFDQKRSPELGQDAPIWGPLGSPAAKSLSLLSCQALLRSSVSATLSNLQETNVRRKSRNGNFIYLQLRPAGAAVAVVYRCRRCFVVLFCGSLVSCCVCCCVVGSVVPLLRVVLMLFCCCCCCVRSFCVVILWLRCLVLVACCCSVICVLLCCVF